MSRLGKKLKHEIRGFVPAAIFFFVAFHVIAFTQALMLEQYGIRISTFLAATLGAFIVAKVVLLADLLPLINRGPDKPLIYNVVWKTGIYSAAALLVSYLEHLFHFLRQYDGLVAANGHLLQEVVWSHFWAVQIWLLSITANLLHAPGTRPSLGKRTDHPGVFSSPGKQATCTGRNA